MDYTRILFLCDFGDAIVRAGKWRQLFEYSSRRDLDRGASAGRPGKADEVRNATLPLIAQVRSDPKRLVDFLQESRDPRKK